MCFHRSQRQKPFYRLHYCKLKHGSEVIFFTSTLNCLMSTFNIRDLKQLTMKMPNWTTVSKSVIFAATGHVCGKT